MTLEVRKEIHSSSGKSKKVRQLSKEFCKHFTAEGTCTLLYRTLDVAGNLEQTRTALVRIDNTPPSTLKLRICSGRRARL